MSKWDDRYVELVTSVARNWGPHGVHWGDVAKEMGESAKACESAFWRLSQEDDGQASTDARLLRMKMNTSQTYAEIAAGFPGYTIEELKNRMKILSGRAGGNKWVEGIRIGFVDIEASDLKANMGIMLSWSLKIKDGELLHDYITREEAIDREKQDKRIVGSLLDALNEVDMVVTWYGTGYDIPFIRSRSLFWGYENPLEYGSIYHLDLYYTARSKLQIHSNRLEAVTEFLGIEGKTRIPPEVWQDARLGYEEALEYVVDHNDEDVKILEEAYEYLRPYKKITRRSV